MKRVFIILVISLTGFLLLNSSDRLSELTFIKPVINKDSLISLGMTERITNQYILIRETRKNQNKSFFIIDTRENLIYLFDNKGKFITKSPTIDGFNRQVNEGHLKDFALKTYSEKVKEMGFKYNSSTRDYVDTTGKNRKLTSKLYFSFIGKTNTSFFPKGEYTISILSTDNSYIGGENNVYSIKTQDNKVICKAIHGLYKTEYRINRMNELKKLIQSNFDDPSVSTTYRNKVLENLNNSYYNNSFGCINVPEKFLELSNNYALNSKVFVIGENQTDYLVK